MIKIRLSPSKIHYLWSIFWLSMISLAISLYPIQAPAKVLFILTAICYAYYYLDSLTRNTLQVHARFQGPDLTWTVNGIPAKLTSYKLMTYHFIFLYFRLDSGARKAVVVWPDTLDAKALYHLRLCLLAPYLLPKYRSVVAGYSTGL